MSGDLVIGIDCSTTAAKAVVWNVHGDALASGRAAFAHASPKPGWGEQHPADWWSATVRAVRAACRSLDPARIGALAITHQRETFACLDADDNALRPAILWLDTRAAAEVEAHGSERVHEITGKPPNTATSWYKLLWLKTHEPEVLSQARRVVDVQTYLVHRLTGLWQTSLGSVDPMGLLDLRTFTLDDELLGQVGLDPDRIGELCAPGEVIGTLRDEAADALGLGSGLQVVTGLGDGQAAGLGVGITGPGRAYLNLGTGIVSGTFSADYRWGRAFRTMYGAVPGTYILETFIGGGTYNVSWFTEQVSGLPERPFGMELSRERVLEAAAADVPAGSDGLLALPYLAGALAPYWDSNARGVLFGLTGRHGRAHMYRALLEGLALEQRLATAGAEQALGAPIERFLVMGGGTRSALWCQIIADVLQRPVEVAREAEATCLGAGMLAAVGAGLHASIPEAASAMSGSGRTYRPQRTEQATYERLFEVYRGLYPSLRESFTRLLEFTSSEA